MTIFERSVAPFRFGRLTITAQQGSVQGVAGFASMDQQHGRAVSVKRC